MSQIIQTPFYR